MNVEYAVTAAINVERKLGEEKNEISNIFCMIEKHRVNVQTFLKNIKILTRVLRTSKEKEGFPMNDAFTFQREPIFMSSPPPPFPLRSESFFGLILHSKNYGSNKYTVFIVILF